MPLRAVDFESTASANSAKRPKLDCPLTIGIAPLFSRESLVDSAFAPQVEFPAI
jgi:hypothetical protein